MAGPNERDRMAAAPETPAGRGGGRGPAPHPAGDAAQALATPPTPIPAVSSVVAHYPDSAGHSATPDDGATVVAPAVPPDIPPAVAAAAAPAATPLAPAAPGELPKLCPTCEIDYPEELNFCPRCGKALARRSGEADPIGLVVANTYLVRRKLGEGGMGRVYLAEHTRMGKRCALKIMRPDVASAEAARRFASEANKGGQLSHPNIAAVFDFGEASDGLQYIAMELVDGPSLAKVIADNGALPPARVTRIVAQTAAALTAAHARGMIHRDLKPENILLTHDEEGHDLVKVVDFGIAKSLVGTMTISGTVPGSVIGTPDYMSPEQANGEKVDHRTDVYALGLVAFRMLTGKLAFVQGTTPIRTMIARVKDRPRQLAEERPDIAWPAAVQAVMDRVLARKADERYQTSKEFAKALAAALRLMDSGRVPRPLAPWLHRLGEWTGRHARPLAAATVAAGMAVALWWQAPAIRRSIAAPPTPRVQDITPRASSAATTTGPVTGTVRLEGFLPAGTQVTVDGAVVALGIDKTLALQPGRHAIGIRAPARPPLTRQLEIAAGGTLSWVLPDLRAEPRSAGPPLALPPVDSLRAVIRSVTAGNESTADDEYDEALRHLRQASTGIELLRRRYVETPEVIALRRSIRDSLAAVLRRCHAERQVLGANGPRC